MLSRPTGSLTSSKPQHRTLKVIIINRAKPLAIKI